MIRTSKAFKQQFRTVLILLAFLLSIFQLFPAIAKAGRIYINSQTSNLVPFYHPTGTYLFGLGPDDKPKMVWGRMVNLPSDNAANWWRINDQPETGFTAVVARAKMSSNYEGVTSFRLNDDTYIFGIHETGPKLWRINAKPETGFTPVQIEGAMQKSAAKKYDHVVSFQFRGEPHIVGIHRDVGGSVWRIKDGGANKLKFEMQQYKVIKGSGLNYKHLAVFYRGEEPYVFGVHTIGANIWRVKKKDGKTVLELVKKGGKFHSYNHVLPFQVGDNPYLLCLVSEDYAEEAVNTAEQFPDVGGPLSKLGETLIEIAGVGLVEWGKGYGVIWEISGSPDAPTMKKISKAIPISHRYGEMTAFELGGRTYLFGIHAEGYANIWRVNENPATGFTLVYYGRNQ